MRCPPARKASDPMQRNCSRSGPQQTFLDGRRQRTADRVRLCNGNRAGPVDASRYQRQLRIDLGRRLPLTNPMHASACRRCTLQSCRSVLGHVATPTAPKSNVMSNGEDCGGWTSALNRIGSSLCSSHAVPSACRVSVPAAAAEIIRAVRHPVAATITRLMVRSRNLTS